MQNDYKSELADQFVELAEYLNRQMHTGRLDEWEGLDMTIPQIKTLVLLNRMGPLRMGNISIYLGRALSATTTVVDRLVEKELVDRISDPQRPQGRHLRTDGTRTAGRGKASGGSGGNGFRWCRTCWKWNSWKPW